MTLPTFVDPLIATKDDVSDDINSISTILETLAWLTMVGELKSCLRVVVVVVLCYVCEINIQKRCDRS
jgi:hypothetical protein